MQYLLYGDFHIHASRERKVIDSGKIIFAITTFVKILMLQAVYIRIISHDVHTTDT